MQLRISIVWQRYMQPSHTILFRKFQQHLCVSGDRMLAYMWPRSVYRVRNALQVSKYIRKETVEKSAETTEIRLTTVEHKYLALSLSLRSALLSDESVFLNSMTLVLRSTYFIFLNTACLVVKLNQTVTCSWFIIISSVNVFNEWLVAL